MLVQDTLEKPVLGNVGTSTEFSIRATAKSFTILSSTLYSNKIKAIIQELGANAKDSHKQAGKEDVPFEVHLPTRFEPHFSIRDFGTGLSHEEVCQIYTTYFASTKTNSNDYVGALGLGSKTPFSYTTNFTVTAIKDGRKGIYTAYINDNGIPCIALMVEHQTQECNGVEVSFAVTSQYDMESFYEEAKKVYKYFKVIPTITGRQSATIEPVKYLERDIIPGTHALFRHTNSEPSIALMGDIAYVINANQFSGEYSYMLNCGICIEFNIGDVDIQANREGLSYIPLTVNAIKQKLDMLNQTLKTRFTTEIEAIPNLWDRYKFYNDKRHISIWQQAVKLFYNAEVAKDIRTIYSGWITIDVETAIEYNVSINIQRRTAKSFIKKYDDSININERVLFVIDDVKRGGVQRAKHYGLMHRFNTIVLVSANKDTSRIDDFVTDVLRDPPNIIKASDVVLPKQQSVKYEAKELFTITYDYTTRSNRYNVHFAEVTTFEHDDAQEYLYIPITSSTMEFKSHPSLDRVEFMRLWTNARINQDKLPFYALRKKGIERYGDLPNWTNCEDYIGGYYQNLSDDDLLSICVIDNKALIGILNIQYTHDLSTSPIQKLIGVKNKVDKLHNVIVSDFLRLARLFLSDDEHKVFLKRVEEQQKFIEDVFKRYPLIKTLADMGSWRYNVDQLAHYVKVTDFYVNNSGE